MQNSQFYVNVINDGGFSFGMDKVTPVTWRITRRAPLRRAYRAWLLPVYMHAWAREQLASKTPIHASMRELLTLADTLRHA